MVMFRRSQSGKHVDARWHEVRQQARTNTLSLDEWGEQEISRFDLDTAQITGEDTTRTYIIDRDIDVLGVNGFDIRELYSR